MLFHRRRAGFLKLRVALFVWLVPSVVLAVSKDHSARALADQAMQTDYVGMQFKKAELKLKKAIGQCGTSACSLGLVARLHRDLATVYIGGLKQPAKGKAELKRALQMNPELQLDPDLTTTDLRAAFKALGGHDQTASADDDKGAPPRSAHRTTQKPCKPGTDECDREGVVLEESSTAEPQSHTSKNWLSLHFEQDFLIYGAQNDVCASLGQHGDAANYSCFQGASQFGYAAGQQIPRGPGNQIAAGVGRATPRVLIGFDRVLGSNWSLGLRVGFAFSGAPQARSSAKFQPLHGELRLNYWFGSAPFESHGLRPYVSLSGGVAEIDGRVPVEYYDTDAHKRTLDAWRKAGNGFAGLGLGLMIPIGASGIVPEVRGLQLFGHSATGFDASLGYAYGF